MIKNACFISYAHGQGDFLKTFLEQLTQALKNYLGPYLSEDVWYDTKGLAAGFDYDRVFPKEICNSACMIVVFTPKYESSLYCLREFLAMETIEKKRVQLLGANYDSAHRMIIPVLLRASQDGLPHKIKEIHYIDFSKFTLASLEISRNVEYIEEIEKIAREIYYIYRSLNNLKTDPLRDCDSYHLPSDDEAKRSWIPSGTTSPFPGRRR